MYLGLEFMQSAGRAHKWLPSWMAAALFASLADQPSPGISLGVIPFFFLYATFPRWHLAPLTELIHYCKP
jgi:hypothetical protein